jgi:WD40 repeat protein
MQPTQTSQQSRRYRPSFFRELIKILLGGGTGIVLAILILWFGFGIDIAGVFTSDARPDEELAGLTVHNESPPRSDDVHASVAVPRSGQRTDTSIVSAAQDANAPRAIQNVGTEEATHAPSAHGGEKPEALDSATPDLVEEVRADDVEPSPDEVSKDEVSNDEAGGVEPLKSPVPNKESLQKSKDRVREIFRKEFEAAASPMDQTRLAETLIEHSQSVADGEARFALLSEAYDAAIRAGDYDLGRRVLDQILSRFQVNADAVQIHLITQIAPEAKSNSVRESVARDAMAIARRLALRQEYGRALELNEIAAKTAAKSNNTELPGEIRELHSRLIERQQAWRKVEQAVLTLQDDPHDADANLIYGLHLCLAKRDWELGLPKLAIGSNERLKVAAAADLECQESMTAHNAAAVGDLWYDIAGLDDQFQEFYGRAAHWYGRTPADASDLDKVKARKRLKELADVMAVARRVSAFPPIQYRRTLPTQSIAVWTIAYSPDGLTLVSGTQSGTIFVWNVETGAKTHELQGHSEGVRHLAFSPDGSTLASAGWDKSIRLWNTANWQQRLVLTGHDDKVHSIAYSVDGKSLWSGGADGTVRKWASDSGLPLAKLAKHEAFVNFVAIAPDSLTLVSTAGDNSLVIWDVPSATAKITLRELGYEIRMLKFSPEGDLLASANLDNTVGLWDPKSGKLIKTLRGHDGWIESVDFARDGKTVISTSDDRTIRLWDSGTGLELFRVKAHDARIFGIAVSPTAPVVATASEDGTIKLWDLTWMSRPEIPSADSK